MKGRLHLFSPCARRDALPSHAIRRRTRASRVAGSQSIRARHRSNLGAVRKCPAAARQRDAGDLSRERQSHSRDVGMRDPSPLRHRTERRNANRRSGSWLKHRGALVPAVAPDNRRSSHDLPRKSVRLIEEQRPARPGDSALSGTSSAHPANAYRSSAAMNFRRILRILRFGPCDDRALDDSVAARARTSGERIKMDAGPTQFASSSASTRATAPRSIQILLPLNTPSPRRKSGAGMMRGRNFRNAAG